MGAKKSGEEFPAVVDFGRDLCGDPPFSPRGCIAQAWTVAELLRAWTTAASFRPAPAARSEAPVTVGASRRTS